MKEAIKVLEVFNHFPPEPFLEAHLECLNKEPLLSIKEVYSNRIGKFGLRNGIERPIFFFNRNEMPAFKKGWAQLTSMTPSLSNVLLKKNLKIIRQISPDLVHFQFSSTAIKWEDLISSWGGPFTFSIRGSDVHSIGGDKALMLQRLNSISEKSAGIHSVSDSLANKFNVLTGYEYSSKLKTIRTTIRKDVIPTERIPTRNQILCVGRLEKVKGFDTVIKALAILKSEGIMVNLSIAGTGSEYENLKSLAIESKVAGQVVFLGTLGPQDLADCFGKAEIFVQSSLKEGFPNTVVEAMISGVPVISSRFAGIEEVITNEENGILFSPGDNEELAKILKKRLADPKGLIDIGKAGQSSAKIEFSDLHHRDCFRNFFASIAG